MRPCAAATLKTVNGGGVCKSIEPTCACIYRGNAPGGGVQHEQAGELWLAGESWRFEPAHFYIKYRRTKL